MVFLITHVLSLKKQVRRTVFSLFISTVRTGYGLLLKKYWGDELSSKTR
jgi:hypothetical protein